MLYLESFTHDGTMAQIRNQPQPLGMVLNAVIDQLGIRTGIEEVRIREGWTTLAGPHINSVTDCSWVKDGTLHIRLTSAMWRQELHLQRGEWAQRLNAYLGSDLVVDIVFC